MPETSPDEPSDEPASASTEPGTGHEPGADDPEPKTPAGENEVPEGPVEPDAKDIRSAVLMGVIFVGTILLAMVVAEALSGEVAPVFEDPEDPTNPLLYLALVVVFTAAILVIAKLGLQRIIQFGILGAVFLTMVIIYEPLMGLVLDVHPTVILGLALAISGGLSALLYYYPEWYVVNVVGISVAAGATGWFGISFGLVPALVLLIAFAVYDAIAVYRTKHMLDLADEVMGLKLPIMLVVPKVRGYSFLEGEELDEEETGAERDALFMGLGDIVIPGVLVVSSMMFLDPAQAPTVLGLEAPLFVALATLAGATVGFAVLMRGVLKGSPHAGLPALNGGALVGFLLPVLWLYGTAPLIPSF